jgi:hypothetical protein
MSLYDITTDTSRTSVAAALAGREQVGFARVVTDRATFAYLADVQPRS